MSWFYTSTLVLHLQKLLLQNFARPLYLWTWSENNETYTWGIRPSVYFVSSPHQISWKSVHWFTSYYGEHKTKRTQHRPSIGRDTVFWKLRSFWMYENNHPLPQACQMRLTKTDLIATFSDHSYTGYQHQTFQKTNYCTKKPSRRLMFFIITAVKPLTSLSAVNTAWQLYYLAASH